MHNKCHHMKHIISILIGLLLSFSTSSASYMPNFNQAKTWILENETIMTELFHLLEKEGKETSIWILDDRIQFKHRFDEDMVKFEPSNKKNYMQLIPRGLNVFLSVQKGSFVIGSGSPGMCGNITCQQIIAKYQSDVARKTCTIENITKPLSTCVHPLVRGWHVGYIKFNEGE